MKKKKHQFHCQFCGSPCDIYKKGKKHRVLVCPECGVLATNPFSLKRASKGAGVGAALGSVVPGVGNVVGGVVGGAVGLVTGKKDKKESPAVIKQHDKAYYDYQSHKLDIALK